MPNFLIIGTARAGTTSLYYVLQQHPEIFLTPQKETNFFAFQGKKIDFKGPDDSLINTFSITTLAAYCKQYEKVTDEKAIGEVCPLYLYSPEAPIRIKQYVPQVKLIAVLRNPVERAYSNYKLLVQEGRERLSFADAVQSEELRIQMGWEWFWHVVSQGFYGNQLKRYYELFDRKQIKVFLFNELRNNFPGLLKRICLFLGVDPNFTFNIPDKMNVSKMPKQWAHRVHATIYTPSFIKGTIRLAVPKQVREKISAIIKSIIMEKDESATIDDLTMNKLQSLYREDIIKTQQLTGLDLSSWMG